MRPSLGASHPTMTTNELEAHVHARMPYESLEWTHFDDGTAHCTFLCAERPERVWGEIDACSFQVAIAPGDFNTWIISPLDVEPPQRHADRFDHED